MRSIAGRPSILSACPNTSPVQVYTPGMATGHESNQDHLRSPAHDQLANYVETAVNKLRDVSWFLPSSNEVQRALINIINVFI